MQAQTLQRDVTDPPTHTTSSRMCGQPMIDGCGPIPYTISASPRSGSQKKTAHVKLPTLVNLSQTRNSRVDDQSASPTFQRPSGAALRGREPRLGHASRGSDRSSQALCTRIMNTVCPQRCRDVSLLWMSGRGPKDKLLGSSSQG